MSTMKVRSEVTRCISTILKMSITQEPLVPIVTYLSEISWDPVWSRFPCYLAFSERSLASRHADTCTSSVIVLTDRQPWEVR